MSIAELIMKGSQSSSESTAWVGDSLQKLGQQVGQALAQKEQQKQAQEMLPFLQQSMQDSMTMAQNGDTAGAYSNIMGMFASNPSLIQNKAALPFFELGLKGVQAAGKTWEDKERIRAYGERYGTQEGQPTQVNVTDVVDSLNQTQGGVVEDEIINPEGISPVVAATLPAMGMPAEQVQTRKGMTREELRPTEGTKVPQTRDQVDAAVTDELPKTPTSEGLGLIKPENMVFPDIAASPPPKDITEKFIKYVDRFAALPFEKQKAEMDNNSIIFPDKKMLDEYKPAKGRGIIEISPAASVGIPGLTGAVEIPEAYMKYIVGPVNVNQSTGIRNYSIKPEIENDAKAKAALGWLNQWQDTSIKVNSNPRLREFMQKAGNDALAIDIVPSEGKGGGGTVTSTVLSNQSPQNQFDLSIKGNPSSKITVTKDEADRIELLQTQTAAANIHNAKFIRLKTTPQTAPKAAANTSFKSVEEAEASGLPKGTIVTINGRKARID